MKKLLILLCIVGVAACSSVKTTFDYSRDTDFSKFKTFQFTENELESVVGQLNKTRIIDAVTDELAVKGLTKSSSPDLLVHVHIKSKQKMNATATTTGGYGRWGWHGGYSSTQINYNEYTEGSMFITLIDQSTEKIIWQGIGTKTIDESASAAQRDKNIAYNVAQIMKNYPPEPK